MLKLSVAQTWCSPTSCAGEEPLIDIQRPCTCSGTTLPSETLVHALQEEAKQHRYPTVDLFLAWVRARISVSFRRLDQPKVSCACLQK